MSEPESLRPNRKIPIGLKYVVDPFSHTGGGSIALGTIFFLLPFSFGLIGWALFMTAIPWFWNDAGMATVTNVEQVQKIDETLEEITYVFRDSQGIERENEVETAKKKGFFLVGQKYPIVKFQDHWQMTTLADIPLLERHPFLVAMLSLWGVAAMFIASGLFARWFGYRMSRPKCELLQHGVHAEGTFSHQEKATFWFRIIGLKSSMYFFVDQSGEQCAASFVRRRKKNEPPEVDVFYDPANPNRSIILQGFGYHKHFRYSEEDERIMTSLSLAMLGWFMKAGEFAVLAMVVWFIIEIFF